MIKKAEEMLREIRENMRGGSGQAELVQLFKPGEFAGKARLIARLTLWTGCSIGMHQHLGDEEVFYIISGEGTCQDSPDGPRQPVQAGDATLTVAGGWHAIMNEGPEPLVLLAVILLTE
jgi:mannose-6-phosphate isomerase-like protein (cupin superfamily)